MVLAAGSEVPVAWITGAASAFGALLVFLAAWMSVRTKRQDSKVDSAVEMLVGRLVKVERQAEDCERRAVECEEREQAHLREHLRDHHGHGGQ